MRVPYTFENLASSHEILPRFVSAHELQVSFSITICEALQRNYMFSFVRLRLPQSENCLIANLLTHFTILTSEYFKSFEERLHAKN